MTQATPRDLQREVRIDGETYEVPTGNQLTGSRQWKGRLIGSQEVPYDQEQTLPLDFGNGAGFSFQGLPGTYEKAWGFAADSRGRVTTWPRFASGVTFTSENSHGWLIDLGDSLYVVRGRYVQKYAIDASRGSSWSIVSTHDLGANISSPGRPWKWQGKIYVPRINSSGVLQKFHQLTTQATEVTEVQTIVISGTPTSGSYTVTFDGKTTAAIAYNADQATVQAALRTLAGLEQVTVVTTGSTPNFTHTVTMTGAPAALGASSPPQMTSTDSMSGGTHAIAHNTTTPGTADRWDEGPSDRLARAFATNNKGQLTAAMDANEIRTCDIASDPLTSGDWAPNTTEGYTVGDSAYTINELVMLFKYVMALKEDGPYSFDEDLYVQPELPDLGSVIDAQNGLGSTYFQGKILMPSRAGLVFWDQESFAIVGPTQEDGLEGDLTEGWGRVSGADRYGRQAFVVANDPLNQKASLWSLSPGGQNRPIIWHEHLLEAGVFDDVRVVSIDGGVPVGAVVPDTFSSDNTNGGTIDWTNASNAADEDDSYASAGAGTTKYLKALNPGPGIPDTATILGITVRVKKSQGVA